MTGCMTRVRAEFGTRERFLQRMTCRGLRKVVGRLLIIEQLNLVRCPNNEKGSI